MALRPPNPLLATDTVQLVRENAAAGARGGLTETAGATTTFLAIVTKSASGVARRDDDGLGAPVATALWDVLLYAAADPAVLVDDLVIVTTQGGRRLKVLAPSYARSTGAYKVECQEIR